jgi:hypothetical protein
MCAQDSNDKNIPFQTDAYYEERALQEEIYLEETEEELRMVLESDDLPSQQSESLDKNESTLQKNLSLEVPMSLHSAKRQSRKCLGRLGDSEV